MKINIVLATAAFAAAAFSAAARPSAVDALSLEIAGLSASTEAMLLERRAAIEAARADNSLPGPEVEVESLWGGGRANKFTGSVSQGFELPSAYRARSRALQAQADVLEPARSAALLEKAYEAKTLIIDYIYQSRRLVALASMQANLDSIAGMVERGYAGGELTVLDLRKVRIRQSALNSTISEAQMAAAEIAGRLNAMADAAGRPADFTPQLQALADYPASLLQPLAHYQELAAASPEAQLAAATAREARSREGAAAAQRLPSFGLGYVFNREEGRNFNGFNLTASLPLWQGRSRSEAARLEARSAELLQESALTARQAQLAAAHSAATRGLQAIADKECALGPAAGPGSWPVLLGKALDAGRISVLDYLNEASYFLEALLELENARHAQALLMADLNRNSL